MHIRNDNGQALAIALRDDRVGNKVVVVNNGDRHGGEGAEGERGEDSKGLEGEHSGLGCKGEWVGDWLRFEKTESESDESR